MTIAFPQIDPVLLRIGPLQIHWYAISYIAGVLVGRYYLDFINRSYKGTLTTKDILDDLIFWAVMGIILGGRLGYVLFYQPLYYLEHPTQILAVWQGGMSFHGGMLGMGAALWLAARKHKVAFIGLVDMIATAAPFGLCFGRLANFINGELYGRVTNASVAMIFPRSDGLPRHPSQLYEAALEGVVLLLILAFTALRLRWLDYKGRQTGMFLVGYAIARSVVECFREPDAHIGLIGGVVSMGQLLCLPMLLAGLLFLRYSQQRHA